MLVKLKSLIKPIESVFDVIVIWASLSDAGLLFALFGVGLNIFSLLLIPIAVVVGYQIAKHETNGIDTDDDKKESTPDQNNEIRHNKASDKIEEIVLIGIPIVASFFLSPLVLIVAPIVGAIVSGILFGCGYLGYKLYRRNNPVDETNCNNPSDYRVCDTSAYSKLSSPNSVDSSTVFCSNCGKRISAKDQYCIFCGQKNQR